MICYDRGLSRFCPPRFIEKIPDWRQNRRATLVFIFGVSMLTALWLLDNPIALDEISGQITIAAVGVVLALIALVKRNF